MRQILNVKPMSEKDFVSMVRPAFPKDAMIDDVEAVLRRTNTVVNTPTDLYLRPAGSADNGDDVVVRRIPLGPLCDSI